jgi:hypothetical protein
MKRRILSLALILSAAITTFAVEKGDFNINTTLNLGHHSFISSSNVSGLGFVPGFTMNMDYAVSDYFGFGGFFTFSGKKYSSYKYRNLGVGVRGVFHLFQLISDKGNTSLDGDKFDLYIPLFVGGGFKLRDKNFPGDKFRGGALVGSAIGITYYFADHIGANAEGGYCEGSYGKFGLSFKF